MKGTHRERQHLMAHEQEDQPIIIYPDRKKILRANGTTFLLGGGLALLALAPWRSARGVKRALIMFSRASLLAWGWLGIPTLIQLLFPKPIVIVNDEGIFYYSPRMGPFTFSGSLAWREIQALYIGELMMPRRGGPTNSQRFLCVLPRDVEAFLRPYTLMSRIVLTWMMRWISSPFVLPEALLPLSIDELIERVRTQYAATILANEIELRDTYQGSFTTSSSS